jgi:hypothetical protein
MLCMNVTPVFRFCVVQKRKRFLRTKRTRVREPAERVVMGKQAVFSRARVAEKISCQGTRPE